MVRDKLNGMIEVSRLEDVNAAELFLGFRIGAVTSVHRVRRGNTKVS